MKIAARRRLALAGAATTTAVLAGLLVLPSAASAGEVLEVTPGTVLNTNTSQTLTFRHQSNLVGGEVVLTRTSATETITTRFVQSGAGTSTTPQGINFADGGNTRATDGPANPGTYDVTLRNPAGIEDSCRACFTIASPGVPTVASVDANSLAQNDSANITITGSNFARGTVVEVLKADGTIDPDINANGNPIDRNSAGQDVQTVDGITTSTTLRRRLVISASAVTGPRTFRVRNTDGSTGTCAPACFTVNGAPLTSVSPTGGTNNPNPATALTTVTFRGSGLERGTPSLAYVGEPGSATREDLSIVGTNVRFAADRTSVTADFDLRNAAPGLRAYQPVLTQSDTSRNACTCRFDVLQTTKSAVTGIAPQTGAAGTTQNVQITGSGFSRGVRITIGGGDVTTTAVRFVSPTRVDATLAIGANALNGPRDVTSTTTDNVAGTACTGCYTVTGGRTAASPSATPTATTSPRPSGSASPSPSATTSPSAGGRQASLTVTPTTIVSQQTALVRGTATPGSVVELLAYSRPSTTYVVVRRGVVGESGTIDFRVGPSGNTRMFLRASDENGGDTVDSASIVLTVRTSINLKVARVGTGTYRFTGSTLPKRRGQLVTVFYENASGGRTIASRARVASDGTYNVTRRFSGRGTFTFFTGTGTDINNAGNNSNRVRTTLR